MAARVSGDAHQALGAAQTSEELPCSHRQTRFLGGMAVHVDDDSGGHSSAQVSWLGLPRSWALGSGVNDTGCREHVLFYWALKALNTEKGRTSEEADVAALAFENGRIREIT